MPPGPRTVPVQSAAPLPTEADCKKSVLLCLAMRCEPGRFARGVWTFSLCLAERDNDGSRGLEPTDAGEHTIRRRGATAERSNRAVAFNRRSATRDQNTLFPWTEVHGYHQRLAPRRAANRDGSRAGAVPCAVLAVLDSAKLRACLVNLNQLFCSHQQNWSASKTGVIRLTRGMRRTWLEPNPNAQNALAAFVAPF